MSMRIGGPTTPLGSTVRIGDLVLEPGGVVNVGGTRMPSGVRIEDCAMGSGRDRALLTKTPEGVVTIRKGNETLVYAWFESQGVWYGPGPRRASRNLAKIAGNRTVLATVVVLMLGWAYVRTKPSPRTTSSARPSVSTDPVASSESVVVEPVAPEGEGREPIAAIVQEIEDQLEHGREGREVLALSADQERQLIECFTARSKTATLIAEEIRPVQMRKGQVESTLGMLKDDPEMPFDLRRVFARLSDPEADQVLYDMSIGGSSLQSLAIRADQQGGRLLRGEDGFTKADVRQAIEAQEALASAHAFLKARHDLIDELLAGVPFLRMKQALSHRGKTERRRTFAALFEVPLEATFDARSGQMDQLFLALDRIHPAYPLVDPEDREITTEMLAAYKPPDLFGKRTAEDERDDREARRLIGGYASRHSTLPARLSRIGRAVAEGRRAAETVFAPLIEN